MIAFSRKNKPYYVDFYLCPGKFWTNEQRGKFHGELTEVASDCFTQVPEYQCLTGKKEELARTVITIARDVNGRPLGFCSAVILDIDGYQNVLHLGLTCVKKEARQMGLTHALTSKLIMKYLFKISPFKRIWITNVACVLSSVGNVALYFEKIFPSPFSRMNPSVDHIKIATELDKNYRPQVAINKDAVLDLNAFVFRGSVSDTVFQKSAKDIRFFHRDTALTEYYLKRLDFKNGDEVIQVGQVGLMTFPKYLVKNVSLKILKLTQKPVEKFKTAFFTQ